MIQASRRECRFSEGARPTLGKVGLTIPAHLQSLDYVPGLTQLVSEPRPVKANQRHSIKL